MTITIPSLPPPLHCDDASGGEMVRTAQGWLCVWCGIGFDEKHREAIVVRVPKVKP